MGNKNKTKKPWKTIPVFLLGILTCSCGSETVLTAVFPAAQERTWCILVYMNGDNDLEAQALKDLNEMEAAGPPRGGDVLVLLDRAEGYDAGDDDWTGTRLYRLRKDPGGMNYTIVSERVGCPALGLPREGEDGELNLGSPGVLTGFITWADEQYPARHRMLILWGHGTGWRGRDTGQEKPYPSGSHRAVSFDDGDADFLFTAELGAALAGADLDLVGFDTCNAMLLEVAYELRDAALLMAGSEGLVSAEGWDYGGILSGLTGATTPGEAADLLTETFSRKYATAGGAAFSVVDLSNIQKVMEGLDGFVQRRMDEAALAGPGYYSDLKQRIFTEVEDFYTTPGDLNIDLIMLGLILEGPGSPLAAVVEAAVVASFASPWGNPDARGLAVHFVPLDAAGRVSVHDDAYFRDKPAGYSLDFVEKSLWCPHQTEESGLLWHLFYGEEL